MNTRSLLEALMKQAGMGASSAKKHGLDAGNLLSGGVLGRLVGSRRGRRMSGKALKFGAIAGVGMLAWKAWQRRQATEPAPDGPPPEDELPFERLQDTLSQERRSQAILKAMIAAACSDGHIDDVERAQLSEQIEAMGAGTELLEWAEQQMLSPLEAAEVARDADSPQAAREMYLASAAIIDDQNPAERAWLDELAAALKLDEYVVRELELQATTVT